MAAKLFLYVVMQKAFMSTKVIEILKIQGLKPKFHLSNFFIILQEQGIHQKSGKITYLHSEKQDLKKSKTAR